MAKKRNILSEVDKAIASGRKREAAKRARKPSKPPSTKPIITPAMKAGKPPSKKPKTPKSKIGPGKRESNTRPLTSKPKPAPIAADKPKGVSWKVPKGVARWAGRALRVAGGVGAEAAMLLAADDPSSDKKVVGTDFPKAWNKISALLKKHGDKRDIRELPKGIEIGTSSRILKEQLKSYAKHATGNLDSKYSKGITEIEASFTNALTASTGRQQDQGRLTAAKNKQDRKDFAVKSRQATKDSAAARREKVASNARRYEAASQARKTAAEQPLAPRGRQDLDRQGTSTGYPGRKKDTILGPGAETLRDPKPSFTKRPDISDAQRMITSMMVPKNVRAKEGEGEIWHSPDQDILDERGSKPAKLITPLAYRQDVPTGAPDSAEESLKSMKSQTGGGTTPIKRPVFKPKSVQKRVPPISSRPVRDRQGSGIVATPALPPAPPAPSVQRAKPPVQRAKPPVPRAKPRKPATKTAKGTLRDVDPKLRKAATEDFDLLQNIKKKVRKQDRARTFGLGQEHFPSGTPDFGRYGQHSGSARELGSKPEESWRSKRVVKKAVEKQKRKELATAATPGMAPAWRDPDKMKKRGTIIDPRLKQKRRGQYSAKRRDEDEWEEMAGMSGGQRKGGKITKKKATKAPAKKQYSTSHRARSKNPTINKTSYNY